MLTLSARDKTTGMNIASTMTSLRTCWNMAATAAQASPAAILQSSQGKRPRKAAATDARGPSASRTPTSWKMFSFSSCRTRSEISSVYNSTSSTPRMRRCGSTTGRASRRCRMKNSQASESVAVAGRAMTCRTMMSASGVSGRIEQQAPRGDHALEAVLGIDHVEVDDAAFDPAVLQPLRASPTVSPTRSRTKF